MLDYTPDPNKHYGKSWESTRPPGLPSNIRGASTTRDGEDIARSTLSSLGILHTWLGIALWSLLDNESSHQLGRPANSYDTRPQDERPWDTRRNKRKSYISAWGIFQYNRDAWRGLADEKNYLGDKAAAPPHIGAQMPHDATTWEELFYPIRRYWLLWEDLLGTGRIDPHGLAVSVRALHSGSGRLRNWLRVWQPGDNGVEAYERWMLQRDDHGEWARDHVDNFTQFNRAIEEIWQR